VEEGRREAALFSFSARVARPTRPIAAPSGVPRLISRIDPHGSPQRFGRQAPRRPAPGPHARWRAAPGCTRADRGSWSAARPGAERGRPPLRSRPGPCRVRARPSAPTAPAGRDVHGRVGRPVDTVRRHVVGPALGAGTFRSPGERRRTGRWTIAPAVRLRLGADRAARRLRAHRLGAARRLRHRLGADRTVRWLRAHRLGADRLRHRLGAARTAGGPRCARRVELPAGIGPAADRRAPPVGRAGATRRRSGARGG
jgi:hypothetical protein